MNNLIRTCCKDTEKEFVEKMLPMPFVARGILASEGFAFCAISKHFKANLILESGVYKGQSTSIWSKFFSNSKVIAIDKVLLESTVKKFTSVSNVELRKGSGETLLPKLIRENSNERITVFIDGPKGMDAIDLAEECLSFDNVFMVGLHDFHTMTKNRSVRDHEGKNIRRIKLDEMGIADFYTDDLEFLQLYSYMDSAPNLTGLGDEDYYWAPYWLMSKQHGKVATFGSYGPTIAFILRK